MQDAHRFADLVEPDGESVERVAVGAADDVELDLVVGEVGLVATQIGRNAGGAEQWSGGREGHGFFWAENTDALQAVAPDRLPGHQDVVLLEAGRQHLHGPQHLVAPAVGQVGGHTAGADVVVVHPQAGDRLEEPQDLLALAPAVDHHRHGAEVHAVGGHEQQVRRDAVHLGHEHADPGGSLGNLDTEEFLGGEGEGQFGEQRRGVVHPGDVGGALEVGQALGLLLHTGVEIPDDRLRAADGFTVHFEHEAKHAVSRRVRRTHVDQHGLVVLVVEWRVGELGHAHFGHAKHRVTTGQQMELSLGSRRLGRGGACRIGWPFGDRHWCS